jgi:cobalamin biosynthesis protein CobT
MEGYCSTGQNPQRAVVPVEEEEEEEEEEEGGEEGEGEEGEEEEEEEEEEEGEEEREEGEGEEGRGEEEGEDEDKTIGGAQVCEMTILYTRYTFWLQSNKQYSHNQNAQESIHTLKKSYNFRLNSRSKECNVDEYKTLGDTTLFDVDHKSVK